MSTPAPVQARGPCPGAAGARLTVGGPQRGAGGASLVPPRGLEPGPTGAAGGASARRFRDAPRPRRRTRDAGRSGGAAPADPVPPGIAVAVVARGAVQGHDRRERGRSRRCARSPTPRPSRATRPRSWPSCPEGTLVQKGDLLLLFDAAPFEEEIRRSQAQLLPGPGRPRQGAAGPEAPGDPEPGGAGLRAPEGRAQPARAEGRPGGQGPHARGGGGGRALQRRSASSRRRRRARGPEAAPAGGLHHQAGAGPGAAGGGRARRSSPLAQRRRDALLDYGRPLELSQARAEALLTKESARQLEAAAPTAWSRSDAAIHSAESRIEESASKLKLAQQQLARTEVRAEVPGIVVYRDVFFGSEQRKPQVGDQVWANQPLIILPDISKMVVETKVRETDVHKVEQNQGVRIRVAGLPGPPPHRPGQPRGDPGPGGEGPARGRSSSGSRCSSTSPSRGCAPG